MTIEQFADENNLEIIIRRFPKEHRTNWDYSDTYRATFRSARGEVGEGTTPDKALTDLWIKTKLRGRFVVERPAGSEEVVL